MDGFLGVGTSSQFLQGGTIPAWGIPPTRSSLPRQGILLETLSHSRNTTTGIHDSRVPAAATSCSSAASGSTGSVSSGGTFTVLTMTTGHCWKVWAAVLSVAADAGEHLVCYDSGGSFSDVIQGGSGSITFTNTTTALKLNNGFVGAETFQYNVVQVL